MEELLEVIYTDDRYLDLVESLNHPDRRAGYYCLKAMMGECLTERKLQEVLAHLHLHESSWKDFFGNAFKKVVACVPKLFRYLLGGSPKKLIAQVKKDKTKMEAAAKEIASKHNITVTKADGDEFIRRAQEGMPRPPQQIVDIVKKTAKLTEYVGSDELSAELFVYKWVLLLMLYHWILFLMGASGVLSLLIPGFAATSIVITHLPVLYVALMNVLEELETKTLVP